MPAHSPGRAASHSAGSSAPGQSPPTRMACRSNLTDCASEKIDFYQLSCNALLRGESGGDGGDDGGAVAAAVGGGQGQEGGGDDENLQMEVNIISLFYMVS